MRKASLVLVYEYPETISGADELLVRTSRQFGEIILRGGELFFELNLDMVLEPLLGLCKQEATEVNKIYIREELVSGGSSPREIWTVIKEH